MYNKEDISLCTVTLDGLEDYVDIMLQSAKNHCKHIKEIFVCKVDANRYAEKTTEEDGVLVRRYDFALTHEHATIFNFYMAEIIKTFGHTIRLSDVGSIADHAKNKLLQTFGHALGLHCCIDNTKCPYIFFCDPDVIFLSPVDDYYQELMQKYDLQYIGCAHESAHQVAFNHFPYIANSMVHRENLPKRDFLADHLTYHGILRYWTTRNYAGFPSAAGNWMIRGVIPELKEKFPIKQELHLIDFDTSSNLYLWAIENNWKWLSFLTDDCHTYKTQFYRSNFKIPDKLTGGKNHIKKLLYHQYGRYRTEPNSFAIHNQVYLDSMNEENE